MENQDNPTPLLTDGDRWWSEDGYYCAGKGRQPTKEDFSSPRVASILRASRLEKGWGYTICGRAGEPAPILPGGWLCVRDYTGPDYREPAVPFRDMPKAMAEKVAQGAAISQLPPQPPPVGPNVRPSPAGLAKVSGGTGTSAHAVMRPLVTGPEIERGQPSASAGSDMVPAAVMARRRDNGNRGRKVSVPTEGFWDMEHLLLDAEPEGGIVKRTR